MKSLLLSVFLFSMLLGAANAAQRNISLENDLSALPCSAWRWHGLTPEITDGALRVRVSADSPKSWGSFGRYTELSGGKNCYLQLLMGEMEENTAAPALSNTSTGGFSFGQLYSGWNTFSLDRLADKKSFYMTLTQSGKRPNNAGPWVDYHKLRIVKQPPAGLVVTMPGKGPKAPVKVGDKIRFTAWTNATQNEPVTVHLFRSPKIAEYQFCRIPEVTLNKVAPGIYSADLVITSDALAFNSATAKGQRLVASTKLHGENHYFTLDFPIEIVTGQSFPSAMPAANLQVYHDRRSWFKATEGKNLALGKKVEFSIQPDYSLTSTGASDAFDLTDGKLTLRDDDKIWFDRSAVGWSSGGGEYLIRVDLGKVEKIEKVVIRTLGGTTGNFKYPRQFDLFVSRDGQKWYPAASMQKLQPGEAAQSDFLRYYYLEEHGGRFSTRMYPFELSAQAEARWIALKITGATGLVFCDELAIIQSKTVNNAAYDKPSIMMPMDDLVICPRVRELAVVRDILLPQTFVVSDLRKSPGSGKSLEMVLELPPGLSIANRSATEQVKIGGIAYNRFILPLKLIGKNWNTPTLFLIAEANAVAAPARIYARCDGRDQFVTELPVRIMPPLPKFAPFEKLHISLGWMYGERVAQEWPDYFANWRKLGFNAVTLIPSGYWLTNRRAREKGEMFLAEARRQGFRVVMTDCSFHIMANGKAPGNEMFCQVPGKKNRQLCPSWQGDTYRKELDRVAECVRTIRPDEVFYDIEAWARVPQISVECERCRDSIRRSGKEPEAYFFDCGTRLIADLKGAVTRGASAAGIAVPRIGSYNRQPLFPSYQIEMFNRIYPKYIDMAQPSLYVGGRASDIRFNIAANHKMLKNKKLIPWLTAGTYGEFESKKIEPMVLEALLNGAGGITYYKYQDFTDSPLDFYYHAKALAMLRAYESLVVDGEVSEVFSSNKNLSCSALRLRDEMLVLVGNYGGFPPRTTLTVPFRSLTAVTDLATGKLLSPPKELTIDVPRGGFRLLHIAGKDQ